MAELIRMDGNTYIYKCQFCGGEKRSWRSKTNQNATCFECNKKRQRANERIAYLRRKEKANG